MGFIRRQQDCRTTYIKVETTRVLSMPGGPATEVNGRTQVGGGDGGKVEVVRKSNG